MSPVGQLLREWRLRRRLTQLELAHDAGISPKHLCFLETGRAQPSRNMLLRLAEYLQVPLRDRNLLLNAAGYASEFTQRRLDDSDLQPARRAIDALLAAHKPNPAYVVDRYWTLIAGNGGFVPFLGPVDSKLLQPPVNVLRLTLHPQGLAPRLANYEEWRFHVLASVRRQSEISRDPELAALWRELAAYQLPREMRAAPVSDSEQESYRFAVPFQLVTPTGTLSFFSTTTVFGSPVEITVAEISLEAFYPADEFTAQALRQAADLPAR